MLYSFRFFSVALMALVAGGSPLAFGQVRSAASTAQPETTIQVKGGFVTAIKDVELAAKEAGVLSEVIAKPGDEVAAGDLLGKMDDADAMIRVEAAKAELEVAVTQAESQAEIIAAKHMEGVAKAEYETSVNIRNRNPDAISETQLRRDELQWRRSIAQGEVAKMEHTMHGKTVLVKAAQLKAAENELSKRQLKSSVSGIVEDIFKDEGEWVALGERVARVVQMDRLRVVGFVQAKYGHQDDVIGRQVQISVVLPNRTEVLKTVGTVDYVSPVVANNEYRIHCDIDNVQDPRTGRWMINPGVRADLQINMAQPAVSRNKVDVRESR